MRAYVRHSVCGPSLVQSQYRSPHLALTHLENKDTHVRMLFKDFSSAFNAITAQRLIGKLSTRLCKLGPGLSRRKNAVGEDRQQNLEHHFTELRLSPGLCAQAKVSTPPPTINGLAVERASSTEFPGSAHCGLPDVDHLRLRSHQQGPARPPLSAETEEGKRSTDSILSIDLIDWKNHKNVRYGMKVRVTYVTKSRSQHDYDF